MLVHKHNTVHVLLMQPNSSFYKLPGGRLKPGEDGVFCPSWLLFVCNAEALVRMSGAYCCVSLSKSTRCKDVRL